MRSFANVTKVENVAAGFLSGFKPVFLPSIRPRGREMT